MQDTLFPHFMLYHLRLQLALGVGRQRLPAYLGSTLRGLFAASFRHLVCVTQAPVCDGCLLLHRCPYPYIFETPPPPHLPDVLQKRFRQAPRPYIFEVPMSYAGEETLELGLVLVGRALDFLPYFLYVIQETGQRGLGRAQVPYRLLAVTDGSQADGPVIFHAEEGIIHDSVRAITLAGVPQQGDAQVHQVTLEFLTPLRIKKYGAYQEVGERIEFATLLDLLLGRLEALALFHCEEAWSPNTVLREAAHSVQVVTKNLSLQPLERYSNRHHQKLPHTTENVVRRVVPCGCCPSLGCILLASSRHPSPQSRGGYHAAKEAISHRDGPRAAPRRIWEHVRRERYRSTGTPV